MSDFDRKTGSDSSARRSPVSASLCAPGRKPIHAVEHVRVLPGAPLHAAADGLDQLIETVLADV